MEYMRKCMRYEREYSRDKAKTIPEVDNLAKGGTGELIKGIEVGMSIRGKIENPPEIIEAPNNNPGDVSRHGLMTEIRFQLEAAERGYSIWKPVDPFSRTDLIISHKNRFHKIQVKGTYKTRDDGAHRVTLSSHAGKYTAEEVDFYAAYVFPTNDWFIIPFAEAKGAFEVLPGGRSQLRYLDAWHLIK